MGCEDRVGKRNRNSIHLPSGEQLWPSCGDGSVSEFEVFSVSKPRREWAGEHPVDPYNKPAAMKNYRQLRKRLSSYSKPSSIPEDTHRPFGKLAGCEWS